MRLSLILSVVLLALPALAQDIPLPRPRPADRDAPAAETALPLPTPEPLAVPDEASPTGAPVVPPEAPPADETAPPPEPPKPHQSACPAVLLGLVDATPLPPIAEGSCMAQAPLSVTGVRVNGRMIPLSSPATLTCPMATQLPAWAAQVDGYLAAKENSPLASILAGTSYACRNVNNAGEGKLSAHAFADALDVTGFTLEDGRTIALPGGWTDPLSPEGRALRFAHDSACSLFMTTLGPEANALHADHLHLDMMCHGASCAARLCE
jgi:hypothetical protein